MSTTSINVSIETFQRMKKFCDKNGTIQRFFADEAINKMLDELESAPEPVAASDTH